jgi:hypothetical protein
MHKPPIIIEKKEPLLKLSKNMGNSISQNPTKKSITDSIHRMTAQNITFMNGKGVSGRNNGLGVKQSVKDSFRGVKQSIGANDSDMDFDLELD